MSLPATTQNGIYAGDADLTSGQNGNQLPKVLFVDDHHVLLDALECLAGSLYSVKSATTLAGMEELLSSFEPDVLVLDLKMPDGDVLEKAREVKARRPGLRILFLSMLRDAREVQRAMDIGAYGFVSKMAPGPELLKAIAAVHAGERYMSSDLQNASGKANDSDSPLTDRQRQVLRLIAMGYTAKQIADSLSISVRTAEFHRATIMERLKLSSTAMMTRYALQHGIA